MTKSIKLVESCSTNLICLACASPDFRIAMEADEATNALSPTMINNVECSRCHALYQLAFETASPNPGDTR